MNWYPSNLRREELSRSEKDSNMILVSYTARGRFDVLLFGRISIGGWNDSIVDPGGCYFQVFVAFFLCVVIGTHLWIISVLRNDFMLVRPGWMFVIGQDRSHEYPWSEAFVGGIWEGAVSIVTKFCDKEKGPNHCPKSCPLHDTHSRISGIV